MMLTILWTIWALINLGTFVLYGADKRRAKRDAWRIPEKALFLPVLLGGGLGGILGMNLFHHKTKHWYFRFGLPAILILQVAAIIAVWYFTR